MLDTRKWICSFQSALSISGKVFGLLAVALVVTVGVTCLSSSALADDSSFQVAYYGNANMGFPDATMHVINPGSTGGTSPYGDLCANIYVFIADQQLTECCSCLVTPNGMRGFSLNTDLSGNPLTGPNSPPHAGAIKIVSSRVPSGGCDAGTWYQPFGQLRSLITHVRNTTVTATNNWTATETEFSAAPLGYDEYQKLVNLCFDIEEAGLNLGSGQGVCGCGAEY